MPTAHPSGPGCEPPLWEAMLPVLTTAPPPAMNRHVRAPAEFHVTDDRRAGGPAAPAAPEPGPQELVDEARREAQRILEHAREQAARAVQDATQQALKETATRQAEALAHIIELIRADLAAQFQDALRSLELDAARLCTALAETVVRRKIAEDDEVMVEVVREGLARMVGAREITLRVGPEAQEALEAARDTLAGDLPGSISITILPDDSITAGGAVLQSANGEIDLRIETQMARLREAAEAALGREGPQEERP